MMFIDMTKELAPVLYGLNFALVVSAAAILGSATMNTWLPLFRRIERPRLLVHRPVLVR